MCGWGAGGERVVPGLGVAWGDVEACPGHPIKRAGVGDALAGQGVSLWHWVGAGKGGVQGSSRRFSLGGGQRGLTWEGTE